ncbi:hypothetical protein EDB89DRAFT_2198347 [Lactarius sanguifluus]|nr:hypothetical protein EDB89DRAFT_2198347 [Lactarius sanguifluus]
MPPAPPIRMLPLHRNPGGVAQVYVRAHRLPFARDPPAHHLRATVSGKTVARGPSHSPGSTGVGGGAAPTGAGGEKGGFPHGPAFRVDGCGGAGEGGWASRVRPRRVNGAEGANGGELTFPTPLCAQMRAGAKGVGHGPTCAAPRLRANRGGGAKGRGGLGPRGPPFVCPVHARTEQRERGRGGDERGGGRKGGGAGKVGGAREGARSAAVWQSGEVRAHHLYAPLSARGQQGTR